MQSALLAVNQLGVSLFIMAIGFFMTKTGILNAATAAGMSAYLTKIVFPVMFIRSLQLPFSIYLLAEFGIFSFGVAASTAIAMTVSYLLCKMQKLPKREGRVWMIASSLGNYVFIGAPIYLAFYGEAANFPITALVFMNNIIVCAIHIPLIKKQDGDDKTPVREVVKSLVTNASLVAGVVAMLLFVLSIRLPVFLLDGMQLVNNTLIPIAMLVLGYSIAQISFKSILNRKVFIFSMVKMLVCPILSFYIFRMFIDNPMILGILCIGAGMPTGAMLGPVTVQHNNNPQVAGQAVLATVLLSVVTVPAVILLMQGWI